MLRSVQIKLVGLALIGGAVFAQTPAATTPPVTENPIIAPKAVPETQPAQRSRPISGAVAAQLAAVAPKYTPPPPKPEPKPEAEQVDMRDVDKPRNGIIRLPKYIVREQKPAVLSERAVNTDKGLTDIAVRRYISDLDHALNRFTIPLFSPLTIGGKGAIESRALSMYSEEERLQNMANLDDAARTVSRIDPAQGAYVRREAQKTYMRTNDFGWTDRTATERK